MKAVIIEDEVQSLTNLKNLLKTHCPQIEIVGTADSISSGVKLLRNPATQPDLVFMDIRIHEGLSFQILDQIDDIQFEVIFVTAFTEYSTKAFEYSGIGYVVKPINPDLLVSAVNKVKKMYLPDLQRRLEILKDQLSSPNPFHKLCISSQEEIHIVDIGDIVRMQGDNNLTQFILSDGRKFWATKTIKSYAEYFESFNFFRIHKKHIVNLNFISSVIKKGDGQVVMKGGTKIKVAKRRKTSFMNLLKRYQGQVGQ